MSYNWKKHVKHSSKKNTDKKDVANYISNKRVMLTQLDNHHLRQQNAALLDLIDNIEMKLRE
jgi:hypothetical protein